MALLAGIGQVLIALGFSGTVAYWAGPGAYAAIALFAFASMGLVMFDAAHRDDAVDERLRTPRGRLVFALTGAGIALVFSAIWPALPLILAWSAWRRRAGERVERDEHDRRSR